MKNIKFNKYVFSLLFSAVLITQLMLSPDALASKKAVTPAKQPVKAATVTHVYVPTKAVDIVNNPKAYVGKYVQITAQFNKFTTLGLDYKPVFRSSQDYITFLINRDNVPNVLPLSEMKIFIKRTEAEKFIDLDAGDVIEFNAKVISSALSDPWLEVDSLKIVEKKSKSKK